MCFLVSQDLFFCQEPEKQPTHEEVEEPTPIDFSKVVNIMEHVQMFQWAGVDLGK